MRLKSLPHDHASPSPRWRHVSPSLWLAALLALVPATGHAQQAAPRIGYVYPAGGRQGTTLLVTVGGQFLGDATRAYVSGNGVQSAFVEYNRPMNSKEFNALRDELKALQAKRASSARRPARRPPAAPVSTNVWTVADEKRVDELRAAILKNPPNRQGNPAIAESVILKIEVAPEAAIGEREIRLASSNGLSNPLRFHVGQWLEYSKAPTRVPNPEVERYRERLAPGRADAPATPAMSITIPSTVNGQIMPGAVDQFRFRAGRGQQLVVAASARELIPYLADAVPGWFQATLALHDASGKELAYVDDFRFHPDPVLRCEIPRDGEYVLEIKDAIYRGREDFVYRLTIGELPFVTGHFPLGGRADTDTVIELTGWNLPTNRLFIAARDMAPLVATVTVTNEHRAVSVLPFSVDTLPERTEKEPNDHAKSAPAVAMPCFINGRIDSRDDVDVFRIEGREGEEFVAEVLARRLDSPLDSMLELTDGAGAPIAFNDDHEDKAAGLDTHHADSYLRATLPAGGTCFVRLSDRQGQGGNAFAYRLRLGAPQPDFALRLVPASLNLRAGGTVPFTIHALRKDGFTNAIDLALVEAPPGFALSGARVPAGQDRVRVTLTAPAKAPGEPVVLTLEGSALIQGRRVSHPAVPAEDLMQAFAYRHLVPAREWLVAVSDRWSQRNPARLLSQTPIRIPLGGTARIRLGLPANTPLNRFQLELSEPPEGVTIQQVVPSPGGAEIVLHGDAAKLTPGLAGNLIFNTLSAGGTNAGRDKAPANRRRVPLATLPAIPFEVVPAK